MSYAGIYPREVFCPVLMLLFIVLVMVVSIVQFTIRIVHAIPDTSDTNREKNHFHSRIVVVSCESYHESFEWRNGSVSRLEFYSGFMCELGWVT